MTAIAQQKRRKYAKDKTERLKSNKKKRREKEKKKENNIFRHQAWQDSAWVMPPGWFVGVIVEIREHAHGQPDSRATSKWTQFLPFSCCLS